MGYSVEIFVEKPKEDLICPICCDVYDDPVFCKDGHTFCSECIREWLKNNAKCPMDKKVITGGKLSPNQAICGFIDNREVYCHPPDHDERTASKSADTDTCAWTGKLTLLAEHREVCIFQQVQCTNDKCEVFIQRRQINEHDKICKYKEVKCEKCQEVMIRDNLNFHKDFACPEELVVCPNNCTNADGSRQKIKRRELEIHINRLCGKTRLQCPFKDQGCKVKMFREDFNNHLQEAMAEHMFLIAKRNSKLEELNLCLANRCDELTDRLKTTLDNHLSTLSTFVWSIKDYPTLFRKHSGSYFRSPNFYLCGYSWYLKLYPNGDKDADAEGFVSLYLCMASELTPLTLTFGRGPVIPSCKIFVTCRFVVMSRSHNTEDVTWVKNFEFSKEAQSTGQLMLMKAEDALSTDYCTTTDGILVVKCTIQLLNRMY